MPDTFAFQALGDETEIHRLDDDAATPVIVVPFPDDQTIEDHQALVHRIVALLNTHGLSDDAPVAAPPIEVLTVAPTVFILTMDNEPWVGDWMTRRSHTTEYASLDAANDKNRSLGWGHYIFEVWREDTAEAEGYRIKAKH